MKENNANAILKKIFKEAVREELQSFIPQLMNEMKHIHISSVNPQMSIREQYGQQFGIPNNQYYQHQQNQQTNSIFGNTSNQNSMMNVSALSDITKNILQNREFDAMNFEPDYEN
jgi:hypothetical protein